VGVETFTSLGTAGDFLALGQPVGTVGEILAVWEYGEFDRLGVVGRWEGQHSSWLWRNYQRGQLPASRGSGEFISWESSGEFNC